MKYSPLPLAIVAEVVVAIAVGSVAAIAVGSK